MPLLTVWAFVACSRVNFNFTFISFCWRQKVELVLCTHEDVTPHIFNLDTGWRWVVSTTPRPFTPEERTPVSLDRRLCGLQDRSRSSGEGEKCLAPTGSRFPDREARSTCGVPTIAIGIDRKSRATDIVISRCESWTYVCSRILTFRHQL
jgi:hypothetical protein